MTKKQLYSQFNRRIQFGNTQSVLNENTGDYDEMFIPEFTLWCKPQKRTANQSYSIYGTELAGTIDVVIRHNPNISDKQKAFYAGDVYSITLINADDSGDYMAYDYLTLSKIRRR